MENVSGPLLFKKMASANEKSRFLQKKKILDPWLRNTLAKKMQQVLVESRMFSGGVRELLTVKNEFSG